MSNRGDFIRLRKKGGGTRLVVKRRRRGLSHYLYDPSNGTLRHTLTQPETTPMYVHKDTGKKVRLIAQDQHHQVTFQDWDEADEPKTVPSHQFYGKHRAATAAELEEIRQGEGPKEGKGKGKGEEKGS